MDVNDWLEKKKAEEEKVDFFPNYIPESITPKVMEGYTIKKTSRRSRKKPTLKQIKAVQYINQGLRPMAAMRKAGYKKYSYKNPGDNLMKSDGVKRLLSGMVGQLTDEGLTTQAMAIKFKEWINAQKVHTSHTEPDRLVPDYDIQVKAYDRWAKLLGLDNQNALTGGKVKRTMTLTEFVNGREDQPGDGGSNDL